MLRFQRALFLSPPADMIGVPVEDLWNARTVHYSLAELIQLFGPALSRV